MQSFDTPEPITADIDIPAGNIQVNAGERTETTVEVRPRDSARDADVRAAEQVEVSYTAGRLSVRDTKNTGLGSLLRKGMVDVTIELPAESRVHARGGYTTIRCEGTVGASEINSSSGNIALDRLTGSTELTCAHGWIRVGEINGSASVKTTTGAITLGTVTGELRAKSAHGDITADRALDSVTVRTTHGSVRIGEVARNNVDLESSYGELEVGIRPGTAAWLDTASNKGVVRSSLESADAPGAEEETVRVRARSLYGDVVVRRA